MPGARSEEQAKASGEGAERVKNEVKKQKMEEQGGNLQRLSLGLHEDASTPGSRPSGVARKFCSKQILPKVSRTSGAHCRSQPIPLSILLCYWLLFHHRNWEPYSKRMTDLLMKGNDGPGEGLHGEILEQFQSQLCALFRSNSSKLWT